TSDSVLDLSQGVHMKVAITNTETSKIYEIFVNDALVAQRMSYSYGDVQLGFACDYAAATIANISVRETEEAI
ncbi:MAG: hypothetical protein ACI4ST_03960, partial [Candidatus Gallimonas sp.]